MPAAATDVQILPDHDLAWYLAFNGRGANGAAIPLRQDLLRAVIDRFYASPARTISRGPSSAKEVAGKYVPTRRIHSGAAAIFSGLAALSVRAAGEALVIELDEESTRWVPVARDRFREERTGDPLAVTRDAEGRIVRLASPLLNGVSEYEPAPAAVRHLPLLLIGVVVLIAAPLAAPVRWLIRKWRPRTPQRADALSALATAALWLIRFAALGWAAYLVAQIVDPAAVSGMGPAVAALQVLSSVAVAAAALVVIDVVLGWQNPGRPVWTSAWRSINACAAVSAVWLFTAFGLVT
jgi:hypothetical protein